MPSACALLYLPFLAPLVAAQLTPSVTYSPPASTAGVVASTSSPNAQWSTVLGNALWFYDAQRSGRLDAGTYGNRVAWRNDSALDDGSDWGIDLTGGWYDAGDYIKATFPLGFTLFALAWGGLTYGGGYDATNQTAYLDGTLRWGFDWLMKAHPSDGTLFAQVGDTDLDNDYWGNDQGIPTPRPAYPVNSSFPGTDLFASTASAFAIASLVYTPGFSWNTTSTSSPPSAIDNATYASLLLSHAKSLYQSAVSFTPYATFSDTVPATAEAYASSGYGDDLVLGALALAVATNDSMYYADAYDFYVNQSVSGSQEVWNWDSRIPAAYVLFAETATARPGLAADAGLAVNLTGWQAEAEAYFDRIVNQDLHEGYVTNGGLLYYNGDSDEASLNPAIAAASLMFRYAPLASSSNKTISYQSFAQGQIDYLMGKNPMNVPFMVGQHPNSPQNPHSAMASGADNVTDIRNDPPTELYVLYGASVGGPLYNDKFWDWRDDWAQCEVALDYNANIPGLAAYMIMTNASDPYYVQVQVGTYTVPSGQPCDAALPCPSGLSTGAKVGIAVGVILAVLLVLALLLCWQRKRIRSWYRGRKFK
ncbi:hypothetical protein Q5752_000329 [Cryptotrichosporon argae]